MQFLKIDFFAFTRFLQRIVRYRPKLRETNTSLEKLAEIILKEWKSQAQNTKQSQARWFGKQYSKSLGITHMDLSRNEVKIGPTTRMGEGAMNVVESGRPEYNMKPTLLNAKNTRTGKNGKYTVIKFDEGTEIAVEHGSSNDFKSMKKSSNEMGTMKLDSSGRNTKTTITDQSSRGFGQNMGKGRVEERMTRQGFLSRMKGFMRKKMSGKPEKPKGVADLQFRVVKSDSTGWVYPQINPENIQAKVYKELKNFSGDMLSAAVKKDMNSFIAKVKS